METTAGTGQSKQSSKEMHTRVRHCLGFPDRLLDACQLPLHSCSVGSGPTCPYQVLLCPRLARS